MHMNEDRDNFEAFVGKEFDFHGVDCNQFKLNDTAWEALEDEDDGYRSYLKSVEVKHSNGLFFRLPLARVKLVYEDASYQRVYKLIDVSDGHVWLTFGTNELDDYYPYFVFNYEAKAPSIYEEAVVALNRPVTSTALAVTPSVQHRSPAKARVRRNRKGQTHKFNRT